MKYEIELPDDVDRILTERATETGEDVVHLIQFAVVRFVQSTAGITPAKRKPAPPLDSTEVSPPLDLPRSSAEPVEIDSQSKRRPDPLLDSA